MRRITERHLPLAALRLCFDDPAAQVRSAHRQGSSVGCHVSPAQPIHLAATKAARGGEQEHDTELAIDGVERLATSSGSGARTFRGARPGSRNDVHDDRTRA